MSVSDHFPVGIVGGGPVGLALAIELGQRGVRCIVIERYKRPQPIPKGQNLTQRTTEHFHFWGAERALRAARTIPPEYGIGGLTAYGTLLGDYHYDWLQRERVRPFYFTDNERLPQYLTEGVLRARVAELPSIAAAYGFAATQITQGARSVTIEIADREGTSCPSISADYVVGCDGSRSLTRESAGITQTRSDHDRLMVLLVFRSTELHDLLTRYPGKSFYNVLHPDYEGYWQFFGRVDLGSTWFFHAPVPASTTRDNTDFRSLLYDAAGAEFDVEFDHVGFWDLRFAIADTYRHDRIFVAGDAAHSHPPYGGYGINTGFEDARNLGWKIAATFDGWGGEKILDSYDAERRPVFASTAHDFIERAIREDGDFLSRFDPSRDRAAFEMAWNARAKGAQSEVGAFEPNYEGSPIVLSEGRPSAVGEHAFRARAGHHLAPQVLSNGRNVFEELGSGFTILAFASGCSTVAAFERAAVRLNIPLAVVRDDAGALRDLYEAAFVLVRPDHFVAWAGDEVQDAGAVLARAIGKLPGPPASA